VLADRLLVAEALPALGAAVLVDRQRRRLFPRRRQLQALARHRQCVSRTLVATKREAPRRCFVSLLEAWECVAYRCYRPALCVNDEALRIVVVGVYRVCIDSAVSKGCFNLSATSSEFRGAPSWHFRDLRSGAA
jgi:hypothetical protein